MGMGKFEKVHIHWKTNPFQSKFRNMSSVGEEDLAQVSEWLELALAAAKEAGSLILEYYTSKSGKDASSVTKQNASDIQTEVDTRCEELIVSRISAQYPSHRIVAEEGHNSESQSDAMFSASNPKPVWFIDPIDGTTNFVHSLPFVCVLIGVRVRGEAVMGVIHAPVLRKTYHATKGGGAFMNGRRLATASECALERAMCLTEYGYDRTDVGARSHCDRVCALLSVGKVRAIRSLGSCGMSMASIAEGVADVYFEGTDEEYGPKTWDMTAGEVIVREAGGVVMLPEGAPFDCRKGRILCTANRALADAVCGLGLYGI